MIDKHDERLQQILENSDDTNISILCYISGFLSNNEEFQRAWESAILDGIFLDKV